MHLRECAMDGAELLLDIRVETVRLTGEVREIVVV
jgi:hypothetical protein